MSLSKVSCSNPPSYVLFFSGRVHRHAMHPGLRCICADTSHMSMYPADTAVCGHAPQVRMYSCGCIHMCDASARIHGTVCGYIPHLSGFGRLISHD
ncbi:hypothetical protein OBBRIDRAFT_19084 [Obba rivulosa]|uniref:Uncharacterized protein n=1 Tax=Obba rivulosa TaxID=1052685 RepID=A0A8E2DVY1_9APHY|nr:hypothetical protein OBBRIDRAFT_19084 [Obba rivulosa]